MHRNKIVFFFVGALMCVQPEHMQKCNMHCSEMAHLELLKTNNMSQPNMHSLLKFWTNHKLMPNPKHLYVCLFVLLSLARFFSRSLVVLTKRSKTKSCSDAFSTTKTTTTPTTETTMMISYQRYYCQFAYNLQIAINLIARIKTF